MKHKFIIHKQPNIPNDKEVLKVQNDKSKSNKNPEKLTPVYITTGHSPPSRIPRVNWVTTFDVLRCCVVAYIISKGMSLYGKPRLRHSFKTT